MKLAAICVAVAGCFNPTYNNPSCGPAGECPNGLVCSAGACVSSITGGDGGGDGARVGDGGGTTDGQQLSPDAADVSCGQDTVVSGKFSMSACHLLVARAAHTATISGNFVYVIGGLGTNGTPLGSVERAQINGDGTIGPFSVLPVALLTPRAEHSTSVAQGFIYVIGGVATTDPIPLVERAAINADGSLSPFTQLPVQLTQQGRAGHTSVVTGTPLTLYVIGGEVESGGGAATTTIDQAVINEDGSLSQFTNGPARLNQIAIGPTSFVSSEFVYAIGGEDQTGKPSAVVQSAMLTPSGNLNSVLNKTSSLTTARVSHTTSLLGQVAYVTGGENTSGMPLATVEAATLDFTGALGAFEPLTVVLTQPRAAAASVATSSRLYVIGGSVGQAINGSASNLIETATTAQLH